MFCLVRYVCLAASSIALCLSGLHKILLGTADEVLKDMRWSWVEAPGFCIFIWLKLKMKTGRMNKFKKY